jgi:hypothetical protein
MFFAISETQLSFDSYVISLSFKPAPSFNSYHECVFQSCNNAINPSGTITYVNLIKSIEFSSCLEANNRSATQDIPSI